MARFTLNVRYVNAGKAVAEVSDIVQVEVFIFFILAIGHRVRLLSHFFLLRLESILFSEG